MAKKANRHAPTDVEVQDHPLFRLPPELRNRIYEYAIGDQTIIHVRMPGSKHIRARKVESFSCLLNGTDFETAYTCSHGTDPWPCHVRHCARRLHEKCQKSSEEGQSVRTPFALLRVSRQVYHDTRLLVYVRSTFHFDYEPQTFRPILLRLSPQQRRTIKSVFVDIDGAKSKPDMIHDRKVPHPITTLAELLPCLDKCDLHCAALAKHQRFGISALPNWQVSVAEHVRVVFQHHRGAACMVKRFRRLAEHVEQCCRRVTSTNQADEAGGDNPKHHGYRFTMGSGVGDGMLSNGNP